MKLRLSDEPSTLKYTAVFNRSLKCRETKRGQIYFFLFDESIIRGQGSYHDNEQIEMDVLQESDKQITLRSQNCFHGTDVTVSEFNVKHRQMHNYMPLKTVTDFKYIE